MQGVLSTLSQGLSYMQLYWDYLQAEATVLNKYFTSRVWPEQHDARCTGYMLVTRIIIYQDNIPLPLYFIELYGFITFINQLKPT